MDKAISYELEGIALAEADHLECPTLEELGLQSNGSHPLVDSPYPAYRDPSMRALIHSRRNAMTAMRKGAVSGKEAVERALHLDFLAVTQSTVEKAFESAGFRIDQNDVRLVIAARYLLDRLNQYPLTEVAKMRACWPTPASIAAPTAANTQSRAHREIEPRPAASVGLPADDSSIRQRIMGTLSSP
ncbi:hypothetical protein CP98_02855 [Sphingobium yanoikuyae]|uniref:Uncharacterized protein n=2 Tax=Sphingobium yanoikuyae TaxID=13690 RepID=A0A084EJ78_SPHYA|nr:hypothetical protein CP98_02855 [Sphingobium yanoikuyae]